MAVARATTKIRGFFAKRNGERKSDSLIGRGSIRLGNNLFTNILKVEIVFSVASLSTSGMQRVSPPRKM
jgi:hypothetical protein